MTCAASDELEALRASVERFALRELEPLLPALDHHPDAAFPLELLAGLRELGLLDAPVEGEPGELALLAAALGVLAGTAAAPAALVLGHVAGQRLLTHPRAHGAGRARWLLDGGPRGALLGVPLYTEPGETDADVLTTAGTGALVLDGSCRFVVNAPLADVLVVPARLEQELAWVAVPRGQAGVRVGESLLTLGMRGCPTADLHLDHVPLEDDQLIASGAGARELLEDLHRALRPLVVALSTGILERSLATAVAYARDRYQGGRQIIEHPEVRTLLAGMISATTAGRQALTALLAGDLSEAAGASLFIAAKEAAAHATADGVQLLGGNGYMADYGQERRMRDAKQAQCLLGRTEPLRQRLVAQWAQWAECEERVEDAPART